MACKSLHLHNVSFTYPSSLTPLFREVSVTIPRGWSGVVGPNGAGKTTFMKLATGLLEPDKGHIDALPRTLYCPQRTDNAPKMLDAFMETADRNAFIIRGQLGVEEDWRSRWDLLSHGERKRTQIAVALWQAPDVLAIDEPTNHIDADARRVLMHALSSFRGIGLLVSHDRDMLDTLCQQCLFIEPPRVMIRPGGYSQGVAVAQNERAHAQKEYSSKKTAYKKLKTEARRRAGLAKQSAAKRSKKSIGKHDHDAKSKIDAVRVTGKDAVGGKLLRQLDGRLAQAEKDLKGQKITKEHRLGIWLPGGISRRTMLLDHPGGSLSLGESRVLEFPGLQIRPTGRIAITGPNGVGKSTLLSTIPPLLNAPEERVVYIPQEIDANRSREILEQARELPNEQLGHVMTIISRLGSRPHRLLESSVPSPGEVRKLLLALGMSRLPHIVIMDEPTNHLDLPSIECLETALDECPCAMLLVSHDRHFLEKLTHIRWDINPSESDENIQILEIGSMASKEQD